MGEGVDPTEMCQSLVDKVAQSRQLAALTDPDILLLFEDWLEELEEEVVKTIKEQGSREPTELAYRLGISLRGANFLLSKIERDEKLKLR
jgi:hypothetical protein